MHSLQISPIDPTAPPNLFGFEGNSLSNPYGLDLHSFSGKLLYYFHDTTFLFTFLGSLLLLLTYYTIVYRAGRNKPVESFGPVFMPPFELSPAALRFIAIKGFDTKCLVVGIMNATIKGCYKVRWASKGFQLSLTEEPDFDLLSNDEKTALSFRKDNYWDKVMVSTSTTTKTNKMSKRMKTYLSRRYGNMYKSRIGWVIGGSAISLLASFASFSMAHGHDLPFKFFSYLIVTAIGLVIPLVFLRFSINDRYWLGIFTCMIYLGAGITGLVMIEHYTYGPVFFPIVLPYLLINFAFLRVMPTYTPFGQKVMGEVLAYKRYLNEKFSHIKKLEGQSSNAVKELPYLIALDMETEHTGYFKNILSRARYSPFQIFDHIYK